MTAIESFVVFDGKTIAPFFVERMRSGMTPEDASFFDNVTSVEIERATAKAYLLDITCENPQGAVRVYGQWVPKSCIATPEEHAAKSAAVAKSDEGQSRHTFKIGGGFN